MRYTTFPATICALTAVVQVAKPIDIGSRRELFVEPIRIRFVMREHEALRIPIPQKLSKVWTGAGWADRR